MSGDWAETETYSSDCVRATSAEDAQAGVRPGSSVSAESPTGCKTGLESCR